MFFENLNYATNVNEILYECYGRPFLLILFPMKNVWNQIYKIVSISCFVVVDKI